MRLTSDLRIQSIRPLISPSLLCEELPLSLTAADLIASTRAQIANIIHGRDPRLLAIVGPCSIHDPIAALEYGTILAEISNAIKDDVLVIMRVYFEKPRTTVGWKGLINDPGLDGSFDINRGLRTARTLLRSLSDVGVPCGCEFLDPISPQFITDLVSWGAIGARTTESQVHRELASGLSMPIGFKNGTGGDVTVAIDAVTSSQHPHRFMGVTSQGLAAIVATQGNPNCHVILRGGNDGPNHASHTVEQTAASLAKRGLQQAIMIDCSHGNSLKDHTRQPAVARAIARQIQQGQRSIVGVMLESFLRAGRQSSAPGDVLTYGQSITDACMDIETTQSLLEELANAVSIRRTSIQ